MVSPCSKNTATPWQREKRSGYTDQRTRGTMCESNEGPRRKSNNDTRTNDTVDKLITRNSGTPALVSRCFDNYFAYSTKLHPPASSKRYMRPFPSPFFLLIKLSILKPPIKNRCTTRRILLLSIDTYLDESSIQ